MYKKNRSFIKEQNIVNQKMFRQKYGMCVCALCLKAICVSGTQLLFSELECFCRYVQSF